MKKHIIIILILTFGYALFSFSRLGSFTNPNTFIENKEIIIENKDSAIISKLRYFTGHNFKKMKLYTSFDNKKYTELEDIKDTSVFSWNDIFINDTFHYLKIVLDKETSLGEIALYDEQNNQIDIKNILNGKKIIDEQDTVPKQISYYNSTYFDEIYFARTAYEYASGLPAYEWVHPPLAKIISSIPIKLFKMAPFYYRFMGNLAATLMIPILYLFSLKLFKKTKYAILTALLLIFDNFHFAMGRLGTTDSILAFFIITSYFFMYLYISTKNEESLKKKITYLFFSSLFIAFSISTKWTGLFAGLGLAIIFFIHFFKNYVENKKITKNGKKILLYTILFYSLIPIIIYISCYLLFPNMVYYKTRNIKEIIDITKSMYQYHSTLTESHPFYSTWYSWLFMYKPVWYYSNEVGSLRATISGIGNPIVWISGTISIFYLFYICFKKKEKKALFLSIGYICFLLPYMNISRGMFLYHYYPCYLFTMLATTYVIIQITKVKKNFYLYYIVIVIFFFLYFYPAISGELMNPNMIDRLRWLPSWIF